MSRFKGLFLSFLLLFFPLSAFANDPDLAIYASHWGIGDGADAYGYGGRLGIPAISDVTQLEFRAAAFEDRVKTGEPGIDVIPLEFGIALKPEFPLFRPFASAGLGYYLLDTPSEFSANNEWGWYLATGLEIVLPLGFSLYAEVNYRAVEAELEGDLSGFDKFDFTNAKGDYDLSGVGANIGLNLRW
ncbi:MAG: outer membrane beta-barrel protein [Bdellovibrionota bacterium]